LFSSSPFSVDLEGSYQTHLIDSPSSTAETNKDELLSFMRTMYEIRRMEIACDTEYKARNIRGFCHLYDGQEAIAVGTQAGLEARDAWITSYRCHGVALLRGGTVESIVGELFGKANGMTGGKGGSMHLYSKKHNFFGGAGIVGAQIPVGVGLAFAAKYNKGLGMDGSVVANSNSTTHPDLAVSISMMGDGAANQGQVWEAANMAALWKLPAIICVENNKYGMGTSIERSSSNVEYYTMGNKIPGIKVDGMNVLAVREAVKRAREHCSSGQGPIYMEMSTYRYHGHSMSDPGITYRTRDEVSGMRKTRDPIEFVKKLLVDECGMSPEELKEEERAIRAKVDDAVARVKAADLPPMESLTNFVYANEKGENEFPPEIRMPNFENTKHYQ
jgi:pyruvate dehydrogenase E1 component alpha subunit